MSDLKLATTDYVDTHSSPGYERISEDGNSLYIEGPLCFDGKIVINANKIETRDYDSSIYINGPTIIDDTIIFKRDSSGYPTVKFTNIYGNTASLYVNGPLKVKELYDKDGNKITAGVGYRHITDDYGSVYIDGPLNLNNQLVIEGNNIKPKNSDSSIYINGPVVIDDFIHIKKGNAGGIRPIICAPDRTLYIDGPTVIDEIFFDRGANKQIIENINGNILSIRGKVEMPLGISSTGEYSDIRGVKFKSNDHGFPTVEFHSSNGSSASLYVDGPVKFGDDIFDKNGDKITAAGGGVSDLIHTEAWDANAYVLIVGNNQNSTFITGPYIGIGGSDTEFGIHIPSANSKSDVYLGGSFNNTIFISGPTVIQIEGVRLDLNGAKLNKLKTWLESNS